ncbi:MAG: ATPase, T2SS/T4P/T4SS family, partial [Verrucomicrobiales bacterium]
MISSPVELNSIVRAAAFKAGCSDSSGLDAQIAEACARGDSPIEAICEGGFVEDEESFFQALAESLAMSYEPESAMDLREPLHGKFPAKLALQHRILPHRLSEDRVELMTYDPFNLEAKQAVAQESKESVSWVVSTRKQILESLRRGYGIAAGNFDELIENRDLEEAEDVLAQEVNVLEGEQDEEATVNTFVNQVFREAFLERATDIHIEPLERDLRIRYRVDGALQEVAVPPNVRVLQ